MDRLLPDRDDNKKCVKKTITALAMIGISTPMALILEIKNRWLVYFSAAISLRKATQ
jgi:hypothetical protein